jgi:glycosyltransferase involved in cell wall biosynthesis
MTRPNQNPVKIAFVLRRLRIGGIQRNVLRVAQSLVNKGIDVDIITEQSGGELTDAVPPGVQVVNLHTSNLASFANALRRYIRTAAPQAIISSLPLHNAVVAIIARTVRPRPQTILVHQTAYSHEFEPKTLRERVYVSLVPLVMPLAYRLATAVTGVSRGVADETARMARLSPDSIEVIPNPMAFPSEADERHPTEKDNGTDPTNPYFVFVGRLAPQKRVDRLVRSFANLEINGVDLVIVGDGPDRRDLETLASNSGITHRTHFLGNIANPESWVRGAIALVLPSDYEGFGNVLIEALACGTQIIATDCPYGPRDILRDGTLGQLVPIRDDEALRAAMQRVYKGVGLADPDTLIRESMNYHPDTIAHQYLAVMGLSEYARANTAIAQ